MTPLFSMEMRARLEMERYRDEGAAAERAKIVAWLREIIDRSREAHFRGTLIFASDAIERGEHEG